MTTTSSSPARWFFGLCAAFAIFIVVGIYSSRMAHNTTGYDDDQGQERIAKLKKLQDADAKTLGTADWVDQAKGTVRIPIDEAMAEEIPTLQAKPLKMGATLPPAMLAPAPATATSSTSPGVANTLPATNTPPADGAAPTKAAAGTNAAPASDGATTNASPTAPTTPPPTSGGGNNTSK